MTSSSWSAPRGKELMLPTLGIASIAPPDELRTLEFELTRSPAKIVVSEMTEPRSIVSTRSLEPSVRSVFWKICSWMPAPRTTTSYSSSSGGGDGAVSRACSTAERSCSAASDCMYAMSSRPGPETATASARLGSGRGPEADAASAALAAVARAYAARTSSKRGSQKVRNRARVASGGAGACSGSSAVAVAGAVGVAVAVARAGTSSSSATACGSAAAPPGTPHSRTVVSPEPDATKAVPPTAPIATPFTSSECPSSTASCSQLAASQNRTVVSPADTTTARPPTARIATLYT